jgi:long-chain acyl-CoA synthetase
LDQPGQRAPFDPRPLDTPAFLVYTSGTTGDPKGVLLRHHNLLANAQATATWHRLRPGDGLMTVLPIHHVNGAIVTGLTSFLAGGRNILNRRFSPGLFWQRLARERAVLASMVPTLLEFLRSANENIQGYDLSCLRYLICGAGPLLSDTVLGFEAQFGVPICHGFGMSETTAYNTQMPMDINRPARQGWYRDYDYPSVGCSLACNEVAILRPDGNPAEPLERGQIAIRGPAVMSGYLNNPEANATAFYQDWLLSGDQGFYQLEDGPAGRQFFFVSGRLKELIIRGGVNISPLEIDEVLSRLPGVAFALAIPFENTFYGEEIAAYIVPQTGVSLNKAEVLAFARQHLPPARCPKLVVFGQDAPFTATGKPKRIQLARMLAEQFKPYRRKQFRG